MSIYHYLSRIHRRRLDYAYRYIDTFQWRHNERDGVSNHQPHDCMLNRLFRRRSKKISKPCFTGFCEGNSPVNDEFPAQHLIQNFCSWWRHQMETSSVLLAICVGNSPVTGKFPAQRPVTRSFDIFFHLRLNKQLSTQSSGWWFETPSRPFWRHCNGFKKSDE